MARASLAASKKNAVRLGAYLVFVDETGFLLIPTVRRSWAPRGQTPILRHRQSRDRLSVISGLTISPRRRRLGLVYQIHTHNLRGEDIAAFLRQLLRHLRGPVIVIWDNIGIHRGTAVRDICRRHRRLHLESLPPYAPELNADEGVWNLAKSDLANNRPDDIDTLWVDVMLTLEKTRSSQRRLRGCVRATELPLAMP